MRKLLFVALMLVAGIQVSYAQKSAYMELPSRLFTQGKEMFLDKNYVGCINTLSEFKEQSKDSKLLQEAEYMIVSSYYNQGLDKSRDLMIDYLTQYPETYHRHQLQFYIGSTYFDNKIWQKTLEWFSSVDMDYLSESDQEDFSYRSAYANLQEGSKAEAKRLFGLLSRNSAKYADPSSYYLAYINFQEGEYDQAIPIFRRLKNKMEYKENATFFLIQSTYLRGNLSETISEGQSYINAYPRSKNTSEVYRLLGNSYYRMGNIQGAIANYEPYMRSTPSPLREDAYQLGEAYYRTKAYSNSIATLKHVASTADLLGQAGYMLLGQSYQKVGDRSNAIMAFDAAARTKYNPSISEEALYNYVMMTNEESSDVFGHTIAATQRFLNEYPKSKYAKDVNGALANSLLLSKNYKTSLEAINSMTSPDRQILEAKQIILFQLGTQKFVDGQLATAKDDFEDVINIGNYNAEVRTESYFWRGEINYREGNYTDAGKDYATYISQASPSRDNYPLAFYNLGYVNFREKDYNKSLTNFKKYVSVQKDTQAKSYSDALNRIGDCFLFNRNYSEADRYYSQASAISPSDADYAEFQKAFVLGLQHNYNGKIAALNSMMAKYPSSPYYDNALFEKSRALVMLDRESEAISVLEKLRSEYPKSTLMPKAEVQLGQLYFNTNNSLRSIEAYKRVINAYPNTDEARNAIQSLEGVYKDMNDISSYASYINSIGSGTILTPTRQDSLTYLAAENVYMKGQKSDAKVALSNYLRAYPDGVFSSDASFHLGLMAFEAKDFSSALPYFNRVINSNNPKYMDDALIYASGIEFERRNYELAYAAYDHLNVVASTSENRDIAQLGMLRCAYLLQKNNDVVLAADRLVKNPKTSPNVLNEARFYRGKAYKNFGKTDAALTDLQIVAKDTRSVLGAESQYLLTELYYNAKLYDKAEKQAQSFMKEGTPHAYWLARSIIILSDVYVAKGDKFQARQYLESLQANYKGGEADIKSMIADRLAALK